MNEIVVGFKRDCSPYKLQSLSVQRLIPDDFSHIATTTTRR